VSQVGENPKDAVGRRKPDLALIPGTALIYMSTAFMDGAIKYGPYNYRTTAVSMWTYLSPITRHFLAFLDGQNFDPKTKVHHLAYVMANCAIILDSTEQGIMVDDRPAKGKTAELLERFNQQGHLMREEMDPDAFLGWGI
jgi:hypothetical protein